MILIDDRSPMWAPRLGNQIKKTNVTKEHNGSGKR